MKFCPLPVISCLNVCCTSMTHHFTITTSSIRSSSLSGIHSHIN